MAKCIFRQTSNDFIVVDVLFLSVCVCTFLYKCLCMCVCTCGSRGNLQVPSVSVMSTSFWDRVSHWHGAHQLGQTDWQPAPAVFLSLPSSALELQVRTTKPGILCGCWDPARAFMLSSQALFRLSYLPSPYIDYLSIPHQSTVERGCRLCVYDPRAALDHDT